MIIGIDWLGFVSVYWFVKYIYVHDHVRAVIVLVVVLDIDIGS